MSRAEQREDTELRDKLLTIIAAAYQVAGAHDAPAHILDVLANPEGATVEQIEAMLPYQPGPLLMVSYNDLMTLARRLIAEQLDDCDEEFLAGRAHGIGSLHSEILGLAKRGALAPAQDEQKGAGTVETCRSSEKAQVVQVSDVRAAVEDISKKLTDETLSCCIEQAEDGDEEGKNNYCTGEFGGVHNFAIELDRWLDGLAPCSHSAGALAPQSSQNEADHALRLAESEMAKDVLSTLLWLYRRLPRGYGRPPTVEGPILALAKQAGIDITDCLAERWPDQQAPSENN